MLIVEGKCAKMIMDYNHYYAVVSIPGSYPITQEDISLKRFRKCAALLLAVLLLITVQPAVFATGDVTFTEVDEVVYATTAVNVRTGPSTSYSRITCLTYGQAIQRIGIGDNGWSKVIYNGEVAYMYSAYLSRTKPNNYVVQIDTAELTRQIGIANGLNRNDYSVESWEALVDALMTANRALNGKDQDAADRAAAALKAAIAALVKVDYSALETALAAVEEFISTNPDNEAWLSLAEAVNSGKAALASGDQAAADAAAAQINQLLAQVKANEEAQKEPEVIIQEVPVEVPPTDDYCNIPAHRVWPVVFFISLAVNIALAVVILVYISRKKRIQHDDTPLVDYDIFDDAP